MKFVAVVFLFALVATVSAHDFSECAGSPAQFGITGITLNPDSPVPGKDLTVSIAASPKATITGGTASLKVTVLGITIATKNFDVCKDLGVTCPLAAGKAVTGTVTYNIPSAAPKGVKAHAEIDISDTTGKKLDCVGLDLTVN